MRPFILEETNWKQVKNHSYEVAVLPWGATEPHNYHLPYGTDSLETGRIAAGAAEIAWNKSAGVMVLPTIPLGVQNLGQIDTPFCLHTRPSSQKVILEDITAALYNQGIRKLVLINGHGGNAFRSLIREIQPAYPGMFISLIEWFKMLPQNQFFEAGGDHANEMETSIMIYYFPELVLPLKEAGQGKAKKFRLQGLNNNTAWAPRHWGKVSEDTGIGNPEKATAEKGEKFLKEIITRIGEYLNELTTCDLNDLYQPES